MMLSVTDGWKRRPPATSPLNQVQAMMQHWNAGSLHVIYMLTSNLVHNMSY